MLIEFTVKNFKSIRDEQKLSMVADNGGEFKTSHTFQPCSNSSEVLLRCAAIYGPNASGKSNLLTALAAMQAMILDSASLHAGKTLPVIPFRLDENCAHAPSEFEVIFMLDGVRYQYGFAANPRQVLEEWLFASPKGRVQKWFSRVWDIENEVFSWDFGKALTGEKQLWQKSTRDNALFLSTAVQLNSKSLAPVYDWFAAKLTILRAEELSSQTTAAMCRDTRTKAGVLAFLQAADFDIADLTVQVELLDDAHLGADRRMELKPLKLSENNAHEILTIRTVHHDRAGRQVEFKLADESDGTRKVFAFATPWLHALQNGHILLIDELHASLHPKLVRFLVGMFHGDATNPHHAQLVFTTHDTSILNQDVFRRDQIWFFEKNREQASILYPLTDFHPRKERENLLNNYLDGRYGALPMFGDVDGNETLALEG